jgi:hypothetical protein
MKMLRRNVSDALKIGGASVEVRIGTPQVCGIKTIFYKPFWISTSL